MADPNTSGPLAGTRITLVFEYATAHNSRILQEIEALQEAGATVHLLTSHTEPEEPPRGVDRTIAPIRFSRDIPASRARFYRLRVADDRIRSVLRRLGFKLSRASGLRVRYRALHALLPETDLFWVIDSLSLPSVMRATRGTTARVLYETVDLVPEYLYQGARHRRRSLREERSLIGRVDGFVTACDSYADYYEERYGALLARRPVVRDNAPTGMVDEPGPVHRPLRLLFLGSLMFDRPVMELIEALGMTDADVTLTFQGRNYLGEAPRQRIAELGIEHRVHITGPCAPEAIVTTAAGYDVGLVALRGLDENERRASTSKLFTYMAAGLAILGSDLPGIARVVDEHRNGILVDGMEPEAWAHGFQRVALLGDADIAELKARSLAAAQNYAWDRQKPRFVAEFVRALGRDAEGPE